MAEPLTYDRLIRQHQSAAEREAAGRSKGLADALTGSLLRGEAKPLAGARQLAASGGATSASTDGGRRLDWGVDWEDLDEIGGGDGQESGQEAERVVDQRARGVQEWRRRLEERFMAGEDGDFEYGPVDEDEELDSGWGEVTREERWFAEERDEDEGNKPELEGQTGVQDF